MNLETYIDNLIYEIGDEYSCTFSYKYEVEKTTEEVQHDSINYHDKYCSPNYSTYDLRTAYVYITEITTSFATVVFKEPILLVEIVGCDDVLTSTSNYGKFNFENYIKKINNES